MNDHEKKRLIEDVEGETEAINEVLSRLHHIRSTLKAQKNDFVTEPAMGTYLMNFYNGIENIMKRISKVYYQTIPRGESWHRDLLELTAQPPEGRKALLTKDIAARLGPYLKFRHRFISGYGFQLESQRMEKLIDECDNVWKEVKTSIQTFLKKI